jgi:hypothetical protein
MDKNAPTSEELLKGMYNNRGKYFDSAKFNKAFDVYIEEQTKDRLLNQKVKLDDLNKVENIKIQPYQLPLNDILINTKNTWLNIKNNASEGRNILDDLNYDSTFYIAITFIIIALLYVMIYFLFI